jgi:hypothetical protein
MTPEDMELLAALGRARAGLKVDVDKTYLVESRLGPLARREGFDSIEAMITALRAKREERLIWAVVEALTFNETSFFRDRDVFAHLRDDVLPALSTLRRDQPIRIWSAACATGQEVYSLAMAAGESRDVEPGAKFEFFGSDLSERCLEKAQSGLYTQFEIQRGLPIRQLVKHFTNQRPVDPGPVRRDPAAPCAGRPGAVAARPDPREPDRLDARRRRAGAEPRRHADRRGRGLAAADRPARCVPARERRGAGSRRLAPSGL